MFDRDDVIYEFSDSNYINLLEQYYENEFTYRNNRKRKNIKLTTDTMDRVPESIIDMRRYRGKNRFLISGKALILLKILESTNIKLTINN